MVASLLALSLGGCAAVVGDAPGALQVASDPPGAQARASTGAVCATPCALPIPGDVDLTVTVSKPGFIPRSIPVEARGAGAVALGQVGGFTFGASTAGSPEPLFVALRPASVVVHGRAPLALRGYDRTTRTVAGTGDDGHSRGEVGYVTRGPDGYSWIGNAPLHEEPHPLGSDQIRTIMSWQP